MVSTGDRARVVRGVNRGTEGRVDFLGDTTYGVKAKLVTPSGAEIWVKPEALEVLAPDADATRNGTGTGHGDCLRALGVVREQLAHESEARQRSEAEHATTKDLYDRLKGEVNALRARPATLDERAVRALADGAADAVRKAVLSILTPAPETPARTERLNGQANGTEERARWLDLDPAPPRNVAQSMKRPTPEQLGEVREVHFGGTTIPNGADIGIPSCGAHGACLTTGEASKTTCGRCKALLAPVLARLEAQKTDAGTVPCPVCKALTSGPVAGHKNDCALARAHASMPEKPATVTRAKPAAPKAPEPQHAAPIAPAAPQAAPRRVLPKCEKCGKYAFGKHSCTK